MPELSHIDPRSAALLVMDYQVDTLTRFMTAAQSADAIARVPDLIAMARYAGMMVLHVVVAFRAGHPEVSPRNPPFRALKANGMLAAGSEGAAIHPAAAERGNRSWSSTAWPVRGHRPGDAATRQRHRHAGARRCPHQRRRAVDRSPRRRSGLSVWWSSAIAAPTQMQRCMRCCSTASSRSRRPSSPRRSSPAPCLAGLHERTRAIDLEKRRHSLTNPFARRFDPRAPRPLHKTGMPGTRGGLVRQNRDRCTRCAFGATGIQVRIRP
jgi:hypothetical protein